MAAPKDAPADLMSALGAEPGAGAGAGPGAGPELDPTRDCVPLASLNMPDESEQMQSPEVGDKVQFTKEGTIESIDGEHAYIKVDAVNGQPVQKDGEDEDETDPENPAEDQAEAEANGGGGDGDSDAAGLKDLQDMASKTQLQ